MADKKTEARALSVADRRNTLWSILDRNKAALARAAGKHLDIDRQIQLARTMISRNPTLAECTALSVVSAVMSATQLNLELDGVLGHAYLVPFKNRGVYEAVFIPGYRGYIALMHRSGRVQGVHGNVVREHDQFKYQEGTAAFLHHKKGLTNRGALIAAYAVCHYKGGGYNFVVLSAEDVAGFRARSPAYRYAESSGKKDSPWHTDEEAMWKKTAIRQLAKIVPLSPTMQRAALIEDYHEAGVSIDMDLMTEAVDTDGAGAVEPEKAPEPSGRAAQLAGELGGQAKPTAEAAPDGGAREPGQD